MNDQPDLFGHVPPQRYPDSPGYVRDAETSRAAAESMEEKAGTLRAWVKHIIANSADGATCDEVEVETGLRHQTASARIRELALKGAIYDTGLTRKTRSRREARVYKVKGASRCTAR